MSTTDFEDRLEQIRSKVNQLTADLKTEEATKNALVMPFIKDILGYDVFNPKEVVPEFTADQGIKKGEKVDYAILKDDSVQILVECKRAGDSLGFKHASQLYRYFSVTNARIAILTNGVHYQFFTDLDEPNRMDKSPFMEIDFSDFNWRLSGELQKLSKNDFDLNHVLSSAGELKYTTKVKQLIADEFTDPSEKFITLFASQVYEGRLTQGVKDAFKETVKKAAIHFLNDSLNARLKGAIRDDHISEVAVVSSPATQAEEEEKIETTADELQGFYIVRAILADVIDINRIVDRDTLSYFGVLLDDNNRKPICRLRFNRAQKYLGLFDASKNETRHPINSPVDIYKFKDKLLETLSFYESPAPQSIATDVVEATIVQTDNISNQV